MHKENHYALYISIQNFYLANLVARAFKTSIREMRAIKNGIRKLQVGFSKAPAEQRFKSLILITSLVQAHLKNRVSEQYSVVRLKTHTSLHFPPNFTWSKHGAEPNILNFIHQDEFKVQTMQNYLKLLPQERTILLGHLVPDNGLITAKLVAHSLHWRA